MSEIKILGHIDICLTDNLYERKNSANIEFLGICLLGREWGELFYNILGCPKADCYVEGENIDIYLERNKKNFQAAIFRFPTLGKLYDIHARTAFSFEQTEKLRDEIYEISSREISNEFAASALRKLLMGCDKAMERKKFLYLNGS